MQEIGSGVFTKHCQGVEWHVKKGWVFLPTLRAAHALGVTNAAAGLPDLSIGVDTGELVFGVPIDGDQIKHCTGPSFARATMV